MASVPRHPLLSWCKSSWEQVRGSMSTLSANGSVVVLRSSEDVSSRSLMHAKTTRKKKRKKRTQVSLCDSPSITPCINFQVPVYPPKLNH